MTEYKYHDGFDFTDELGLLKEKKVDFKGDDVLIKETLKLLDENEESVKRDLDSLNEDVVFKTMKNYEYEFFIILLDNKINEFKNIDEISNYILADGSKEYFFYDLVEKIFDFAEKNSNKIAEYEEFLEFIDLCQNIFKSIYLKLEGN